MGLFRQARRHQDGRQRVTLSGAASIRAVSGTFGRREAIPRTTRTVPRRHWILSVYAVCFVQSHKCVLYHSYFIKKAPDYTSRDSFWCCPSILSCYKHSISVPDLIRLYAPKGPIIRAFSAWEWFPRPRLTLGRSALKHRV